MADGSLLITIDDSLKARVQKAASEAGSSIDEFMQRLERFGRPAK
jgi:hypothetical protein